MFTKEEEHIIEQVGSEQFLQGTYTQILECIHQMAIKQVNGLETDEIQRELISKWMLATKIQIYINEVG